MLAGDRTRRAGGGRKRAIDLDATLLRDLDALVEPTAPGDPDSPLRWTCQAHGRWRWRSTVWATASATRSPSCCTDWYSLQGNAKIREGRQPCRQGSARNGNSSRRFRWTPRRRSWSARSRTRAAPARRRSGYSHDFVIPCHHGREGHSVWHPLHRRRLGECRDPTPRVSRYGRSSRWWQHMGRPAYRQAQSLHTADAGGSNGARLRLSKWEHVNRTGLVIRLSAGYEQVEQDRASVVLAHPLVDLATIVSLIGSTHSRSGLRVRNSTAANTRVASPSPMRSWRRTPRAASLSRRLELHDPSRCSENTKVVIV